MLANARHSTSTCRQHDTGARCRPNSCGAGARTQHASRSHDAAAEDDDDADTSRYYYLLLPANTTTTYYYYYYYYYYLLILDLDAAELDAVCVDPHPKYDHVLRMHILRYLGTTAAAAPPPPRLSRVKTTSSSSSSSSFTPSYYCLASASLGHSTLVRISSAPPRRAGLEYVRGK